MPKRRYMDALEELSDTGSSSSEDNQELDDKRRKCDITLDDLQKCGYKSGPSVLFVPEPRAEETINCHVSDGREHKRREKEETWEEREVTRAAVTVGVEATAQFARKRMEQAERLREEQKTEQTRLLQERRLTFKQKEKRKREAGQAKRGKNFVEEEKRIAREYGVYSNFDH